MRRQRTFASAEAMFVRHKTAPAHHQRTESGLPGSAVRRSRTRAEPSPRELRHPDSRANVAIQRANVSSRGANDARAGANAANPESRDAIRGANDGTRGARARIGGANASPAGSGGSTRGANVSPVGARDSSTGSNGSGTGVEGLRIGAANAEQAAERLLPERRARHSQSHWSYSDFFTISPIVGSYAKSTHSFMFSPVKGGPHRRGRPRGACLGPR
jgi:hypothetical protein